MTHFLPTRVGSLIKRTEHFYDVLQFVIGVIDHVEPTLLADTVDNNDVVSAELFDQRIASRQPVCNMYISALPRFFHTNCICWDKTPNPVNIIFESTLHNKYNCV